MLSNTMRDPSGENCAFNSDRVDPITRTGAPAACPGPDNVMRHVFSSQLARVKARRPCSAATAGWRHSSPNGDRRSGCSGCCSAILHNATLPELPDDTITSRPVALHATP